MNHDFHVHSTYSDGRFLYRMASAASDAGLDGIGFADHCNVSTRGRMQEIKRELGFNLDITYERRREAIEQLRGKFDLRVYDAVEMDYHPDDEAEIEDFLSTAGFEYAIGSVHHLEDVNVHVRGYFADKSEDEREELVASYFDMLVELVDSELFEVAAHVDLVERNPALRGYATEAQYRRVAEAFAESRTIPELNAGRVLTDYGEFHPTPDFLDILREYDVEVTIGSDSHQPSEIRERTAHIEEFRERTGLEPIPVPGT